MDLEECIEYVLENEDTLVEEESKKQVMDVREISKRLLQNRRTAAQMKDMMDCLYSYMSSIMGADTVDEIASGMINEPETRELLGMKDRRKILFKNCNALIVDDTDIAEESQEHDSSSSLILKLYSKFVEKYSHVIDCSDTDRILTIFDELQEKCVKMQYSIEGTDQQDVDDCTVEEKR